MYDQYATLGLSSREAFSEPAAVQVARVVESGFAAYLTVAIMP
ncbi:hypothetical protein [Saccharopolyspora hattusasensis]